MDAPPGKSCISLSLQSGSRKGWSTFITSFIGSVFGGSSGRIAAMARTEVGVHTQSREVLSNSQSRRRVDRQQTLGSPSDLALGW